MALLAGAPCGLAAADAQVGGCVIGDPLKGGDHTVQETFNAVEMIGIQLLVGVVERNRHHKKEKELEQNGQKASRRRRLAWRHGAAPSGQRLGVRAALGVDCALSTGLV